MKIGIIFTAFNCASTIEKCLESWISIKSKEFVYACVSVPFKQYQNRNIQEDNTVELIRAVNIMDYHVVEPKFIEETEARGLCLQYLKDQNCDLVFMVDGDELFTIENINNIIEYVDKNPNIAWFKLSLKNYVFNEQTYLEEPFTPARIYRTNFAPFKLGNFTDDNNICFSTNGKFIPDIALRSKTIPKETAWIKHITWMSNLSSKNKVLYQRARGWNCSYSWNDIKDELEFNPDYYKNKQLPKVIKEN